MRKILNCKLENVCKVYNGKAYSQEELLNEGKYKVLRVGNFFSNNSWYYSDLELDDNKYCDNGDLLFAWSASFGPKIWKGNKTIYHYHIWKLVVDEKIIDKFFLYYYLLNRTKSMLGSTHGSIMLHLTKSFMESLPMAIPADKEEQQKIAAVLSALDTKIELNNRINAELEAMAKTLYDYWFVQFDFPDADGKPYKSCGGKMVYDAALKREIPEGWEVKPLSTLLDCNKWTMGRSHTFDYINYLDTSSLTENVIEKTLRIDLHNDKLPSRAQRIINVNDILFSTVRPNQNHFGLIKTPLKNMIASTGFAQLSSNTSSISNDLIYVYLTSQSTVDRLQRIAESAVSAYPSISPNDILKLKIALPEDSKILSSINQYLDKTFKRITVNLQQNKQLTELRDWLLPMLMNGQVTVAEAEERVAMAAEPEAAYGKQVAFGF